MSVRLILVDDHRVVRDGLRLLLEKEPDFAVVAQSASAAETRRVLAQVAADVIVVDLNLPDESGLSVIGHIRETHPGLRVVVLTGDPDGKAAHDAVLAGANAYLRKEDASDELVRAIRAVADGKNYFSPAGATAIANALVHRSRSSADDGLSERELAVLKGLAVGQSYKEIASDLNVSAKSVETYRARLVKKLGCATRADLVRYAIRQGLIKA